jgi:hypothetical protein
MIKIFALFTMFLCVLVINSSSSCKKTKYEGVSQNKKKHEAARKFPLDHIAYDFMIGQIPNVIELITPPPKPLGSLQPQDWDGRPDCVPAQPGECEPKIRPGGEDWPGVCLALYYSRWLYLLVF